MVFERSVILRPLMQTFQVEKTESSYIVTWRHFSATMISCVFIIVVLFPLCFLGTVNLFHGKNVSLFILAVFWGIWLWSFGWLLNILFGKTRFVLDCDGLKAIWTCFLIKQKKQIDINDIHCFKREDYPRNHGKSVRKQGNWATRIRVACQDDYFVDYVVPIGITNVRARKELDNICVQLNAFVENLKPEGIVQSDSERAEI